MSNAFLTTDLHRVFSQSYTEFILNMLGKNLCEIPFYTNYLTLWLKNLEAKMLCSTTDLHRVFSQSYTEFIFKMHHKKKLCETSFYTPFNSVVKPFYFLKV